MNVARASRVAALPLIAMLGLSACTAAQLDDETYVDAPVEEPAEVITANPVEPDTTLIVTTTATAPNGAQLALELQVHQSTAWDYAGTLTLPAALIEDCAAGLTDEQFASEAWSFTRVNITAIPTGESAAEWPADLPISVEPSAAYAMISGRGMLATPADAGSTLCLTDKSFAGPGRGALAMGIPADAVALTAWAGHTYGFAVEGAELSQCEVLGTDLGAKFGASGLITTADATTCSYGPQVQTSEF